LGISGWIIGSDLQDCFTSMTWSGFSYGYYRCGALVGNTLRVNR